MEIRYQETHGQSIGIITLNGRLDAANSHEFKTLFTSWAEKTGLFVIDCTDLDFIDSSGIGALVACLRKVMNTGGDIHLASVNAKVTMVLELTRANQILAIHATMDEALLAIGESTS